MDEACGNEDARVVSPPSAVCRFCLEDVTDATRDGTDADQSRAVMPCACRGTAALVHVTCLRKWQTAILSHRLTDESVRRAMVCEVCREPLVVDGHTLEPVIPKCARSLCVGTLLVATENLEGVGRTFHHSVILVCQFESGGRVRAVDLTRALPLDGLDTFFRCSSEHASAVRTAISAASSAQQCAPVATSAFGNPTEGAPAPSETLPIPPVRCLQGGPVCGGRFGVVQYTVLATFVEPSRSSQVLAPSDDTRGLYCSGIWETLNARELAVAVHRFVHRLGGAESDGQGAQLLLFKGHTAWARGQLESEIQRGNWAVCMVTAADIFGTPSSELWERLRASGRLQVTSQPAEGTDA
eukprot:TRINITY_DN61114_c0_g1_i1.p1 TRINITY_DN61114_c0_g1~~TRINITY_DN61114_c0_g1_i1.p1  ORF type:complete len:376 (+),score=35.73 TRINITY_DN61114_c0_g1_i1:65-1129(+)